MKLRPLSPLLLSSLFVLSSSFEFITHYGFVDKSHPVHFSGEFRDVGPAKFRTRSVKGTHQKFRDAYAFGYFSHYLTDNNFLSWKAGYSFLDFDWPENPRFKGKDYHFASGSLGWVSTSIPQWRWILSLDVSVDTRSFNFGQTGVYLGTMWGRYQYTPKIGMHIGWHGYVGVKNGYLLPILGIDWHPTRHWGINAIFPVSMSITYAFNPHWSLILDTSMFGRPYRFPMRVHDGIGKFKNGIFEIYSKGVDLDLKFSTGKMFSLLIGGGWNFGGWTLVKDHANHHGKYYKFNGAPYGQVKATFTF